MLLKELMPLEDWVNFEKAIHDATGMNAAVFDEAGVRLTSYVAWANGVCPCIKGDTGSAQAICAVAHQEIAREAQRTSQPAVAECDAGMLKICVPIIINGNFLGVAGGCGKLPEKGQLETFHVSRATGRSEAEIVALGDAIPRVSSADVQAAVDFIVDRLSKDLPAAG